MLLVEGTSLVVVSGLLRERPVLALGMVGVGVLLLAWECCRPGAVLPGIAGLALLLLGGYGLALGSVRSWAVVMVVVAWAGLLLPWRRPQAAPVVAVWATALLCAGLGFLLRGAGTTWLVASIGVGAGLGCVCGGLTTAAGRARRVKLRASGNFGGRSRAAERWE